MKDLSQQHLFKTTYCWGCKQVKVCGELSWEYCCRCSYQNQLEKWVNYLTYEKALAYEERWRKEHRRELLRLVKGESLIDQMDFTDWKKFYRQKSWGIKLEEWLRSERVLPVDSECARKWREDKGHLPEECGCLERKARKLHLDFTECLREEREKMEGCECEESEKVRVGSDYYGWCEKCERSIGAASKKRVIRNRNDPNFWGVSSSYKILCLECIGKEFYKEMEEWQRKKFREYRRRGYV